MVMLLQKLIRQYKSFSTDRALRYLPIVRIIKSEATPEDSILEVGSGSLGITPYLGRKITGLDTRFNGLQTDIVRKVYGSAEKIPFPDNAFDYVICVDMLEHIKPTVRSNVISELLRVGKKKVFLASPCGKKSEEEDLYISKFFLSVMGFKNPYLEEHINYKLPRKEEILKMCGHKNVIVIKNVNLLLHRYIMKTQFSKGIFLKIVSRILNLMFIPLLSRINYGDCYRYVFVIDKSKQ